MIAAFLRRADADGYRAAPVPPHPREIGRFARIGAPIGGQWVIDMLAFALFTTLVARMGDATMAASQAFVMLLSISFMQAVGISVAASTLVGRYIGAGDYAAAQRSFWSSQKFAGVLAGLVTLLFLAVPDLLLRIFSSDPEVLRLGTPLVRLGALFQLFDCFAIVAGGSLRGAGDTRWPFLAQTALAWGMFLPLAYLFGIQLDHGLTGAWVGGTLYVIVLSLSLVARFMSGAWQRMQI
jgi:MATE family multidrug resistance protein